MTSALWFEAKPSLESSTWPCWFRLHGSSCVVRPQSSMAMGSMAQPAHLPPSSADDVSNGPSLCPEGTSDNSPPISSVGQRANHSRSPEGRQKTSFTLIVQSQGATPIWESLWENVRANFRENLSSLAGLRMIVARRSHRWNNISQG
jgi:hypothetical protein